MFVLGKQYGAFLCKSVQNDFHKNIACLVVIGMESDVTVVDKTGADHTAPIVIIKPLVEFKVTTSNLAWFIYLAPYSGFAVNLNNFEYTRGVSKLPANALPFQSSMANHEFISKLDRAMLASNPNLDHRLAGVLKDLSDLSPKTTLVDIAKRYNLSPSRLRVIAKEQIGVPLSMLIVWQKLVKSSKAMSSGSTLSEAAHAGGFSDQAHFSRTILKMFGTTPSNTLAAFDYEN